MISSSPVARNARTVATIFLAVGPASRQAKLIDLRNRRAQGHCDLWNGVVYKDRHVQWSGSRHRMRLVTGSFVVTQILRHVDND